MCVLCICVMHAFFCHRSISGMTWDCDGTTHQRQVDGNTFWQCGNNQTINANSHIELHLHRKWHANKTHLCIWMSVSEYRLCDLLADSGGALYVHLHYLWMVLFVSASFIVCTSKSTMHTHSQVFTFSAAYTDFTGLWVEFQNYSHVHTSPSVDISNYISYMPNHEWSHKSCYGWLQQSSRQQYIHTWAMIPVDTKIQTDICPFFFSYNLKTCLYVGRFFILKTKKFFARIKTIKLNTSIKSLDKALRIEKFAPFSLF